MMCLLRNLHACSRCEERLKLYCFPNRMFHISGFPGQDTGVMQADAVTQVYAMLSYS
jgi:hypothetical protein